MNPIRQAKQIMRAMAERLDAAVARLVMSGVWPEHIKGVSHPDGSASLRVNDVVAFHVWVLAEPPVISLRHRWVGAWELLA